MELDASIVELFPQEITKINSDLVVSSFVDSMAVGQRANILERQRLMTLIDALGFASADGEGLLNPVTTGFNFIRSNHTLYLIREKHAGRVIGMLKTALKTLFLRDWHGTQYITPTLCILELYVLVKDEPRRSSVLRRLFEFMLRDEAVQPKHLAYDSPSPNQIRFLMDNYRLTRPLKQLNFYVVFDGFFDGRRPKDVEVMRLKEVYSQHAYSDDQFSRRSSEMRASNGNPEAPVPRLAFGRELTLPHLERSDARVSSSHCFRSQRDTSNRRVPSGKRVRQPAAVSTARST